MTVHDDVAAGRLRWASEPSLDGDPNEDRIGMVNDAVWVLDGATTPATVASCCDKDASWYVERLNAALTARLEGAQPELRDALAAAIAEVQDEHARSCPNPTGGRGPSSTVAIARRDGAWLDVLVLGDSTVLLDHSNHITAIRDTRLASVAAQVRREIETALANGHGYRDADHEQRRTRLVEAERLSRNRDGGYWIAADQPRAVDHALTGRHRIGTNAPNVSRVLLLSDGMHGAASRFALYDSNERLFAAAADDAPETCIRKLRAAEASDPTGQRYPRTKRSDDASLVIWEIDCAGYARPA